MAIQLDMFSFFAYPKPVERNREIGNDGVIYEAMEQIHLDLKRSNVRIIIYISRGASGYWYFGRHIHTSDCGESCLAFPRFSDQFTERREAIRAAIKKIRGYFGECNCKHQERKEALQALASFEFSQLPAKN